MARYVGISKSYTASVEPPIGSNVRRRPTTFRYIQNTSKLLIRDSSLTNKTANISKMMRHTVACDIQLLLLLNLIKTYMFSIQPRGFR